MDQTTTDATSDSSTETAAGAETALDAAQSSQGEIPAQNLAGEFNRKIGKLQQQLETLMSYVTLQQQAQVQQQQAPVDAPTDEDLWKMARDGNRQAFEEYQRRIASRELSYQTQSQNVVNLVDRQLGVLFQKYPVLRDATSPLAQAANQAYSILVANGYPQNRATVLEAAKTAIADNPDIIAELHGSGAIARDQMRRSATQVARAGVTGATYRQSPPTDHTKAPKVNDAEAALAKAMNVKDPAGAKKRFLQRQEQGRSQVSPVIQAVTQGEEF